MKPVTDEDAWREYPRLRPWFNKLHLALEQGIEAFPAGCEPKAHGAYIRRPIYNLCGMGRDACVVHMEAGQSTDDAPPGSFYQPYIPGVVKCITARQGISESNGKSYRNSSVVLGYRRALATEFEQFISAAPDEENPLIDIIEKRVPALARDIAKVMPAEVCIEMIWDAGRWVFIDVHFRDNPDAAHGGDILIPVHSNGSSLVDFENCDFRYVKDRDGNRVGFLVGKKKEPA